MTEDIVGPLFSEEAPEVQLTNAPLARVLAQVRFPEIQSVQDKRFVAGFQERIRRTYPRANFETINGVMLGPTPQMTTSAIWRYFDNARKWRISLSDTFMSFETNAYTSRKDFTDRLRDLLEQLGQTIAPTHIDRIGIRYVDQIALEENESMSHMLRKEMIGVNDIIGATHYMVSELEGETKEGRVLVRWGHMPPDASHDPEVMPALHQRSWFLDVDSFRSYEEEAVEFNASAAADVIYSLATRAYTIFRWSVTDQFLDRYGRKTT
ncbi:TIGR04255 family protein [Rhizobium oryzicola]|uniref:TIGR04255 family protein n=1 Tax=Rhizobium oryzicola TaxID=1232668 RepID=A0ABT8T4F6_9HYPH|nr:TIGR04255 family protein [Rhizobium oryzicola]MDO1585639.1 TIGR04255 family protein [Rhizobium oryzicola]